MYSRFRNIENTLNALKIHFIINKVEKVVGCETTIDMLDSDHEADDHLRRSINETIDKFIYVEEALNIEEKLTNKSKIVVSIGDNTVRDKVA